MVKPKPVATSPTSPTEPTLREFIELVKEDWRVHGRTLGRPGFQALFAYRLGVYRNTMRHAVLRKPLSMLYRVLQRRARNVLGIELSHTAHIGRRVKIAHQGAIVIHPFAVIGDDCLIRQAVTIAGSFQYHKDDKPTLGSGVRLGAGAVLAGTFVVGDGARIGPNAVVTTDVPAGAAVMPPRPRIFLL